ncbi:hypothetical protein SISNIDRAFT_108183 [Sistotremastrum niveocremeum HHB9708]|uniref:Uncharacterized protein n=2 Tax=Sistotremastraceae TaxID=3402574 RepID=A0A164TYW9_9AGAM|nr:hypothetical protein SISNIDRAFT_108183 [Sistotremastrum niveocremeum HHB9708]KZT32366.1 hypothetical protein SISSUDRAFT_551438 [Sistotremastrum suecicum HHB10207 ss-3]
MIPDKFTFNVVSVTEHGTEKHGQGVTRHYLAMRCRLSKPKMKLLATSAHPPQIRSSEMIVRISRNAFLEGRLLTVLARLNIVTTLVARLRGSPGRQTELVVERSDQINPWVEDEKEVFGDCLRFHHNTGDEHRRKFGGMERSVVCKIVRSRPFAIPLTLCRS